MLQARVISTGDTDLQFKPETNRGHELEVVFGVRLDVLFLGIFREMNHQRIDPPFKGSVDAK